MPNGRIDRAGLVDDSAVEALKELDNAAKETIDSVNDVEKALKRAFSTAGLGNSNRQAVNTIRRSNTALTEQEKVYRQLAVARERNTSVSNESLRQLVSEREQRNRLVREIREEVRFNQALENSYERLRRERDRAFNTLRDLASAEKQNTAELRRAQREYDRLDRRVQKANTTVRNFTDNVGNYQSGLRRLTDISRELIAGFGIVEGLRLTFSFAREAAELARQAKGIEFAFAQLGTTGVKAFEDIKEASAGALSDLEIKRSLNELNNFNLDLEQAGVLFEFLTVRALQTGQSFDKLRDSLVEGLSKESLLRIDNLGISTADLNRELERTPDFITAVGNIAQREVSQAGSIIEDAANSSQTLSAAWENYSVSFGRTLQNIPGLRAFSNILNEVATTSEAVNIRRREGANILQLISTSLRTYTSSGRESNRTLVEETRLRQALTQEITRQNLAYIALNDSLAPLAEGVKEVNPFDFLPPAKTVREINDEITKLNELIQQQTKNEEVVKLQERIDLLVKERDAILGTNETRKVAITVIQGTITAYQNEIRELTKLRDSTATTTTEYQEFERQIGEVERKIRALTDGIETLQKVQNPIGRGIAQDENPLGFDTETVEQQNQALVNNLLEQERKKESVIRSLRENRIVDAKRFNDEELEILRNSINLQTQLAQEAEGNQQRYEQAVLTSIQSIFDARVNAIDRELEEERRRLDAVLNDVNASEEQKLAAEQKFAEQEQRLLDERQKREREAFLVQQGLALAQIALDLAKTITAINLAAAALDAISFGVAGQIYRGTNIPIAVGTAASQTAIVLAQSIPAFYKGKGPLDNYEGPGTWGEKRREVLIDKSGNVTLSPNRTTPIMLDKDDIIMPSIDSFKNVMSNSNSEVFKRVSSGLQRDTNARLFYHEKAAQFDYKRIEEAILKGMKRHGTPMVNANVIIKEDKRLRKLKR